MRGVFKIYHKPESPNGGRGAGVCTIYTMNPVCLACSNNMLTGIAKCGACLRYMMNRNCNFMLVLQCLMVIVRVLNFFSGLPLFSTDLIFCWILG